MQILILNEFVFTSATLEWLFPRASAPMTFCLLLAVNVLMAEEYVVDTAMSILTFTIFA